ncbi:hypothetical protein NGM10_06625 [Halorussus salilacus]|uniref:hypothetical protein n=1 Tax=Halorussus salilacus TaxID=2953750 RepID=UPI0020A151ED|nr:hypothetical protein [Halorussus salilacus]USZ69404.1 hypothetical protein NGM10_06625 [Halorussus salilacus]
MEITITLDHGPLNAEFTGEDREELEDSVLGFVEFLEQNKEVFDGTSFSIEQNGGDENPGLDAEFWEEQQDETEESNGDEGWDVEVSYGSIPTRTGLNEETLSRYFDIDPEGEEPPYLNFDPEILGESGNSRSEKQMRSSLILMTLWRECNDIEAVRSPDLKDAVRISGVDDNGLFNMYQFNNGEGDRYFRRDGSGANTDISLTLPGEREGYDQIQRTVERLEAEEEDNT